MSKQPLLKVNNLKTYFKSGHGKNKLVVKAVDDISFEVYKGEVFGLVGESGCGKTTTGRTIIKLHEPTGGSVYYDGAPIAVDYLDLKDDLHSAKKTADAAKLNDIQVKIEELKKLKQQINTEKMNKIQMIFQDPIASLNPRMTVKEIIAEGLYILGEKDQKVILSKVNEMLKIVGLLPEHANRYPHEFSGGQRQRIGIARALIVKPDLLIADEPISALDVSIQAQVINLLSDLKDELGITILFIAHDLSVVKYFSDRIGVMYYGKLVELASSEELFKHPIHPYTKALLSAVPHPDPIFEKTRVRMKYDSSVHNYETDQPVMREISEDHFVYCNEIEFQNYLKEII